MSYYNARIPARRATNFVCGLGNELTKAERRPTNLITPNPRSTDDLGYMPTKRDLIENENLSTIKSNKFTCKGHPEKSYSIIKQGEAYEAIFDDKIVLEKSNPALNKEMYNLRNSNRHPVKDTFIVTQENGVGKSLEHKHYLRNLDGSSYVYTMKYEKVDGKMQMTEDLKLVGYNGKVLNKNISEETKNKLQRDTIEAFVELNERIIAVNPRFEEQYENLIYVGY